MDVYLSAPMQVNQTNLTLARSGFLDLENTTGLVSVLWSQGTLFPDLGTIAFANDRGEFVGANRPENYVVLALQDETGGAIRKLEPGPQGEITGTILSEKPGYDARKRSWYQDAVAAGHATWTDINLSVTTARLDLSAVTPHYDPSGTFRGVFLVDVALPQITRFLQEHLPDERAVVFIVDRKGALVASSAGSVVHRNGNGARLERATATQSADPVVAHAALYVQEQWGGFSNLRGAAHGTAELSEGLHFISAAAYQHGNGLDWVIVSAIPETAVTGPIQASAQSTLALGVLAFLLTVLGGVWIAHWVANPLAQIAKAAKEIGAGAWSEPLRLDRSDEVGELAEAFNGMAQRLKTSLDDLSQEVALRTRQAHELEESEQRTRAMVRAMPDILFVMGEDGRFLDCQSPDPNHLYLPPGEIIGKTIAEVLPPESAVAFTDLLERTRAEGTLQTLEYTLPIGDRDMFFEARTVPYQQGQTLALCRDITERHIAEREFRSMEQQAAQSQRLEAIGTLSSGIAHDFNNLLQAILGYAELLSFELKPGSPPHEHAEKVKSAAERGRVLVQGLLAFNRKEPLELGPVSLNREVEQSVALLERTLPKMVSIRTHLAEDLHPILGDANQLSQ
ncbi:MAG TPA: HAMP domain-containing protein, partial [Deferrisomatales bacterium]|nr:HAMP domain-containing protein [Deferrisomatales bacterium]